jgi:hypothetical protein
VTEEHAWLTNKWLRKVCDRKTCVIDGHVWLMDKCVTDEHVWLSVTEEHAWLINKWMKNMCDWGKQRCGSGIRDEQPESYFRAFDADLGSGMHENNWDPGSAMENIRIRDPRWKIFRSGINIPDPQHWRKVCDSPPLHHCWRWSPGAPWRRAPARSRRRTGTSPQERSEIQEQMYFLPRSINIGICSLGYRSSTSWGQKQFTEDPASEGSNILVWFGSLSVLPSPWKYCEAQLGTVGEPVY